MNSIKKNTDPLYYTLLFIVLAFIIISFASNEKKSSSLDHYSSIQISTLDHYTTTAVVPSSIELPICASFVDENNIILDYSVVNNYLINLRLTKEYNTAQEKLLFIKPFYNRVFRNLTYPKNEEGDSSFLS